MSLWNCALHGITGPQACCPTAWRVEAAPAAVSREDGEMPPPTEDDRHAALVEQMRNEFYLLGRAIPEDVAEDLEAKVDAVLDSLTSQLSASRSRVAALEADAERLRGWLSRHLPYESGSKRRLYLRPDGVTTRKHFGTPDEAIDAALTASRSSSPGDGATT